MRLSFLLLLLANLVFFAWANYWQSPNAGHEPERLGRQLQADRVRILPPSQPRLCQSLSDLDATQLDTLRSALAGLDGAAVTALDRPGKSTWWVGIPALESADVATRKEQEMRRLIAPLGAHVESAGSTFAVVVARFDDEATAKKLFDEITAKGVRSARLLSQAAPPRYNALLRWPADAADAADKRLRAWREAQAGGSAPHLRECVEK